MQISSMPNNTFAVFNDRFFSSRDCVFAENVCINSLNRMQSRRVAKMDDDGSGGVIV